MLPPWAGVTERSVPLEAVCKDIYQIGSVRQALKASESAVYAYVVATCSQRP